MRFARLRAKGRRPSRWTPYGFHFGPGGRLVSDRDEEAVIARVGELRAMGLSLRAMSRALAGEGIMARNGRPLTSKVLLALTGDRTPPNDPSRVGHRASLTTRARGVLVD
jgi:hypothetical protein